MDHFQSIPRDQRAEPFVKWAGGKSRFLGAYDSLLPSHFETYHEPFMGGASVFFFLRHIGRTERAILSDINPELVHLYRTVRDDVERLIAELMTYRYDREFYYAVRSLSPAKMSPVARAARMLYLNRTCFNGLYRTNRAGQFNVPIGRYDNPVICNASNLRNVHRVLQGTEIQRWSYETVLEVAQPGDFLYMDPPFEPVSASAAPPSGVEEVFNESHQGRLYEIFRLLDRRGCLVMLSTTSTNISRQLYSGFDIRELQGHRAGRRGGGRRGRPAELVVRNYA